VSQGVDWHEGNSLTVRFVRCDRGQMTIIALLFFVALMAIGGLALDMGRLYSLQGQIQTYVDNAALAGASQLDGQSNAICRAVDAIIGPTVANTCATPSKLVTGQQYFAAGTSQLSVLRLTFLSSLGADPGARGATPAAGDVVELVLGVRGIGVVVAGEHGRRGKRAHHERDDRSDEETTAHLPYFDGEGRRSSPTTAQRTASGEKSPWAT